MEVLREKYPSHKNELDLVFNYVEKCLWHEMTVATISLVAKENSYDGFLEFHDICLLPVREHLNAVHYAQIVLMISSRIQNTEQAAAFLRTAAVTADVEANMSLNCEAISVELTKARDELALKTLGDIEKYLIEKQHQEVQPLLHMQFYRLTFALAYLESDYDAYYHAVFKYLAYCDNVTTLKAKNTVQLAINLTTAALLSDKIHHFGEFVSNNVISTSLVGERAVLLTVLKGFNDGEVDVLTKNKSELLRLLPVLAEAYPALERKIQIMALLHLTFYTPVSERILSFSKIASRCCIPETQVELMLLKALALGLIRGEIDGVDKNINITYVIPRVLQANEMSFFVSNLTKWSATVESTETGMNRQVEQLTKTYVE